MGKTYASMLPEHESFIRAQKLFFVGTAASNGHVNISPKGYDAMRVLSPNRIAYLDLTGSGNETSAHLTENSRITFMFIAFDGKPLILRLYGTGRVVLPESAEWADLALHFALLPGYRQIITAEIDLVKTSCGYGVPFYAYEGERSLLLDWANHKGEEELQRYRQTKNAVSMDGILTPIGKPLDER
ncbi:pyridoxamine 5'-phosphate oxidase family protein [Paenibacillus sp. MWE-103]|uniref:Pyridoxamine 5'-phosphate oxidase family protein n=1 Tax=Paenibacillus artemisiicola TaxID=1172618 RepID=A0ABS3WJG1_9BACL|nr:pyridoxamine 5'-phosphate oxidase family protein [Paenibacillus artemisiicola]MBO7748440.1 pyridoxamine 5'-phosphate oxidase family protein [Paenibacillus artemisiicola]